MRIFVFAASMLAVAAPLAAAEPTNFGAMAPNPVKPFTETSVATFEFPWKLAFLPDGRMLVTEKSGNLQLVGADGTKTRVSGMPKVLYEKQAGLFGVFVSPRYKTDGGIYLTYAEPGEGGATLALAWAKLVAGNGAAHLEGVKVLWREGPPGQGGQYGGLIAFAPDGKSMFMTVGDRQRFTPAQDPDQVLGKIVHLTLDGQPAPGNPNAGKTGAAQVALIAPPKDTEAAKTAPVTMVTLPGPNTAPAQIWATGFRTPYGLAFDAKGKLWEVEHGPRGGDELNLIQKGANYGWPYVSYGVNYDAVPIPNPDAKPEFVKPALYWVPVIAPGGLAFHNGKMFKAWKGSAFVGGMGSMTLNRITFNGDTATQADRWAMGHRIRDVEVGPDGAVYVLEDEKEGRLLKLTPAK